MRGCSILNKPETIATEAIATETIATETIATRTNRRIQYEYGTTNPTGYKSCNAG